MRRREANSSRKRKQRPGPGLRVVAYASGSDSLAWRKYVKRWLIWTCFLVIWTTLLLLPRSSFDAVGLNQSHLFGFDRHMLAKLLHVSAYALFAVLSGWLFVPARFRWFLLFFVVTHGTATELIQESQLFPGRDGELKDVGWDNLGVLLGLLISWKWWSHPK